MDTLMAREVYEQHHRSNCLVGRDSDGRPVIYTRCAEWGLGVIPPSMQSQSICMLTDYLFATMPVQCDTYIWLFNLEGFGYEHLYIEPMKEVINTIQKIFVSTNHRIVCAYPNFVTRMVWRTLQPFFNERIKQKVVFIPELTEASLAQIGITLADGIPQEFGGGPDAFSIVEGQQA